MPKIEVSSNIKSTADGVYSAIKNMESFPDFMRDIKSLKIIKKLSNKIISEWEIDIEGAPVKWKEEDIFDDKKMELSFNALEGDYKEYRGKWKIVPMHNCTKVIIQAEFDWGIPVLERYVDKALRKKARLALGGMLQAIKNKMEK
ncbi:MAG: SRPBCC family protein [Candidatus Omnitrophica bacterium]|nr:SRPBCC family protein [Candidatus Omnitrophota bacterium]